MYGECWFTGKLYFKHGGSQNATLRHGLGKAAIGDRHRVIIFRFNNNNLRVAVIHQCRKHGGDDNTIYVDVDLTEQRWLG